MYNVFLHCELKRLRHELLQSFDTLVMSLLSVQACVFLSIAAQVPDLCCVGVFAPPYLEPPQE